MLIDVSAKLHTFKGYIQELEKCVRLEHDQVVQQLDHINSLLNKAVLRCKASLATSTSPLPSKPLDTMEYITPGQNLQQQQKGFSKTTLTPGRKKNGLVLRYFYFYDELCVDTLLYVSDMPIKKRRKICLLGYKKSIQYATSHTIVA